MGKRSGSRARGLSANGSQEHEKNPPKETQKGLTEADQKGVVSLIINEECVEEGGDHL